MTGLSHAACACNVQLLVPCSLAPLCGEFLSSKLSTCCVVAPSKFLIVSDKDAFGTFAVNMLLRILKPYYIDTYPSNSFDFFGALTGADLLGAVPRCILEYLLH